MNKKEMLESITEAPDDAIVCTFYEEDVSVVYNSETNTILVCGE